MTIGFDGWLDDELQGGFASFDAAPLPAGAPYRSRHPASARQWFAARIATRTVVFVVVAALGLMATSALAATAVTGTADPQVWTRHIINAIGDCTTQVATGRGGNACVKAIVRHDGPGSSKQVSRNGRPAQTVPAPTPGASPGGSPDGGQNGQRGAPGVAPSGPDPNATLSHPTNNPKAPPTAEPSGRPSDVPSGLPTAPPKAPPGKP